MDSTEDRQHTFHVVTWNCRRASSASALWDNLLELDPDVALLQDYGTIPDRVLQVYTHAQNTKPLEPGRSLRYMSGVLVKGPGAADIPLPAPTDWVARELASFGEFFTAKAVSLHNGIDLKVLSVYSPAFPIDRARLEGIGTTCRGSPSTITAVLGACDSLY